MMKKILKIMLPVLILQIIIAVPLFASEFVNIPDAALLKRINLELRRSDKPLTKVTKSDMEKLVSIDIANLPGEPLVKSLEGLQYAINLETINCSDSHAISDLTPISRLPKLKGFDLDSNIKSPLKDLSPLLNLPSLNEFDYMDISNSMVTDISIISKMPSLEVLHISSCQIKDFTPIKNSKSITELWADNCNIKDVTPFVDITFLSLKNNNISDITPFINHNEQKQYGYGYINLSNNNISEQQFKYFPKTTMESIINNQRTSNILASELDVNGTKKVLPTIIVSNTTLIPIRQLCDMLEVNTSWNKEKQQIIIKDNNSNEVILKVNSKNISINGQNKTINIAPKVLDGITYLPARVIAESLGYNVKYDSIKDIIYINK